MLIGICDDSPELCTILKGILCSGNYLQEEDHVIEFHNAAELLAQDNLSDLDLLFLDIEMPGMSGMKLMKQHRQLFRRAKIVFLTSHLEYVFDAYEVKAYRFLQKPVDKEKLQELFESIESEQVLNRTVTVRNNGTNIAVRLSDIVYVEVYNNYSFIITPQNHWKSYTRLKEIRSQLPEEHFYQPNKSYVINMNYIQNIDRKNGAIYMSNGSRIDIAHRNRKTFERIHAEFLLQS